MYTPGPWTEPRIYTGHGDEPKQAVIYGGGKDVPASAGLHPIAVVNLKGPSIGPSTEQMLANAKLIAAAPELLEAAQNMIEYARFLETLVPEFQDDEWNRKVDAADAAIAKATQ